MTVKKKVDLEAVWSQVPTDYYQQGVKKNLLQRFWHLTKLRTVKNLIGVKAKKILDVGCASGWFLNQLQNAYPKAHCFGIDPYKNSVIFGKKIYPRLHLKIADGHHLPFSESSFDVVVCTEVLEHVRKPSIVLREIKRVLKKDGCAIIEMDTGNWLFNLVWRIWKHLDGQVWTNAHLHIFTAEKLKKLIIKEKFRIENSVFFNFGMAVAFKCRLFTQKKSFKSKIRQSGHQKCPNQ